MRLTNCKQACSTGSLLENSAKYSDYVVKFSVNSQHDISTTMNMTWEFISKASNEQNRSKTADFGMRTYSIICKLQVCFSPIETFYPRHVQCPKTWAMCEIGVTNSVFFFFDIQLLSLEHVTITELVCTTCLHFNLSNYTKTGNLQN